MMTDAALLKLHIYSLSNFALETSMQTFIADLTINIPYKKQILSIPGTFS